MFIRQLTRKKGDGCYTYLKVVENVWRKGKTYQRTLVNFGNIDRWSQEKIRWLIGQLETIFELPRTATASDVTILRSQHFGSHYLAEGAWRSLRLSSLMGRLLKRFRLGFDPVPVLKAMVFNRLAAPRSKLALSRWLPHQCIPGVPEQIPLHHFYRVLPYLVEIQQDLEKALFLRLRNLLNLDLSLVFYDVTSSYLCGSKCSLARHGFSREHRPDHRQIEVALVVNGEGLPIAHRVFAGDVKDVATVPAILDDLKQQFSIRRCIFVGDSGMISEAILQQLRKAQYEYIVALKARVDRKAKQILELRPPDEHYQEIKPDCLYAHELAHPCSWADHPHWSRDRFVACHYAETARHDRESRERRLQESEEFLQTFHDPQKKRFRDDPARIQKQIQRFLKRNRTTRFFEYDYAGPGRFSYSKIPSELEQEARYDGLFLLQSNSSLPLDQLVLGYLTLTSVEDAFRELKDFLHLRPIRHWTEAAVRGHVAVCVLAYLLERVLEQKFSQAGLQLTARAALDLLQGLDAVTYDLQGESLRKITPLSREQKRIFSALGEEELPVVWKG